MMAAQYYCCCWCCSQELSIIPATLVLIHALHLHHIIVIMSSIIHAVNVVIYDNFLHCHGGSQPALAYSCSVSKHCAAPKVTYSGPSLQLWCSQRKLGRSIDLPSPTVPQVKIISVAFHHKIIFTTQHFFTIG